MSPRTVITWAQKYMIFKDMKHSFRLTFLKKGDKTEKTKEADNSQS